MNAILIDNEQECNDVLSALLRKHCPMVQVVAVCKSAQEAMLQIRKLKPDLIFLDIEMEGMSGLDMLLQLQPVDFEVIFVTGFDQYAQQAIRLSALDYIHKPPLAEDIMAAVLRAGENRHKKEMLERYETFFNNMMRRQHNQSPGRIALPASQNTIEYVDLHNILYVEADRAYSNFYLFDGRKIVVAKNLKEYEEVLDGLSFQRPHRSYLVNLEHVRYFHRNDEQLELHNGAKLPVSKTEKEALLKRLGAK